MYHRVYVGNARPFVVFSLLKRFLVHVGYELTLVMNITDVNDKIDGAARGAGIPAEQLARDTAEAYIADTDRLGLGRAGLRAAGQPHDRRDDRTDRATRGERTRLCGAR
jgi:cysteinyl-tRNA synthetase